MRLKLGEILVRAGVIEEAQLLSALGEQKTWGHRLGVTLVKMGFVTEEQLVNGLANQLELPIAHLEGKRILPEVLALVPEPFADEHMCLPLFIKREANGETLFVGMDDPCDLEALDDLAFRTGLQVKPVLVASSELCQKIDYFYRGARSRPPRDEAFFRKPGQEIALTETLDVADSLEAIAVASEGFPEVDLAPREKPEERTVESPAAEPAEESSIAPGSELELRELVQVLVQLLLESGVIGREELDRRIAEALEGSVESR